MSDVQTSLYTAIRPETIDDMYGNTSTLASLQTLIEVRPEARKHVIMLHGPIGCGKTTLARIIARAFGATNSLSLLEQNAGNTRGIDSVRELTAQAKFKSLNKEPKVYIIDESHQLTPAAQEGFLKPLEDMPPDVYYIFCTSDPMKLITGIRSRCTQYQVMKLKPREMTALLDDVAKKIGFDLDPLINDAIVEVSDGRPRDAVNNLEKIMYMKDRELMLDVLEKGTANQIEIIQLSKLLTQARNLRAAGWQQALKMLDGIDAEPEAIRRAIAGFMAYKLKNTGSKEAADDYAGLLRLFTHSVMYSGKPLLFSMVFQACCGSVENV